MKALAQNAGYRTQMRRSRFRLQLSRLMRRILSRKIADRTRPQSLAWSKFARAGSNGANSQRVPGWRD